jgi:large subunit ribosomal protein L24
MHIKKGDTVIVTAGKDKGKTGKVLFAIPKTHRVLVEGVNMVTKHQKPTAKIQQGGIVHQESPIHVSNVMYYEAKTKKGTRIGHKFLEDGKKVRVSKRTGEVLD